MAVKSLEGKVGMITALPGAIGAAVAEMLQCRWYECRFAL